MPVSVPLYFAAPGFALIAWGIVLVIFAVAGYRRVAIRRSSSLLLAMGVILLATAAGRPSWNRPARPTVVVMVDLSPSTRGATFRDPTALLGRVHQLLGDVPFELLGFSDHNQALQNPPQDPLADVPCDQTIFAPPEADAVLLFSDGQFDLPAYGPPTYPVIDPALDHPGDAAITDLTSVGSKVLATVKNAGSARPIHWTNATGGNPATPTGRGPVIASLPPGDLWPENDSLALEPHPPDELEQWWIGPNPPPGWTLLSPSDLPTNPADYLRPSTIVLNNVGADALTRSQQDRLLQYVRDLGGSLVLVGGDHAFAAGFYDGTPLDQLSPLASSPPGPAMQWMLLIDASGSMAGDGTVPSPWKLETDAIQSLLPQLPAHDLLSVGSFAARLNWWSAGRSVSDTLDVPLPPSGLNPGGPTNLAVALDQIATSAGGSTPAQLLLMTDADAELTDGAGLAARLVAKKIHLHLLAIGNGKSLGALRAIASVTGGSVLQQLDAGKWISDATLLLRSALPDRYQHQPVAIINPPQVVSQWNQTWLKPLATELTKSANAPMSAQWQLGLGKVVAIAYPAGAPQVELDAARIAQPPRDPRFSVSWTTGTKLHIEVNAVDRDQYLNDEPIEIEMPGTPPRPIRQNAPGQYSLILPAPRMPQLITVRDGSKVISRFAVAGRYPPEFDAIGNDPEKLKILADRTGGRVIQPGPVKPINIHRSGQQTPVDSAFAFAGFALISMGLLQSVRPHRPL